MKKEETEEATIYLIIQKGYEIFGQGTTKEEAVESAREWIDKDKTLVVEDLPRFDSASFGEFCITTKDEYNRILLEIYE